MQFRIIQPRFRKHFRIRVYPPAPCFEEHRKLYLPLYQVKKRGEVVITDETFGPEGLIDLPDYRIWPKKAPGFSRGDEFGRKPV